MPTESLLQLVAPSSPATATDITAPPASPEDAPPTAAKSRPSLQERRLLATRDLNSMISGLEQEIVTLSESLNSNQNTVRSGMTQLQQRVVTLMTDLMRLSNRLERSHRQQGEQARQLDQRLSGAIGELGRELQDTATRLHSQKDDLAQLRDDFDRLDRLQQHLDKLTTRQGRTLGILTTETRQQFQITRSHFESLHSLYQQQQSSLLALSSDHDLLAQRSAQLQVQLAGLETRVETGFALGRRQLRLVAGALTLLAVVSLGLMAWFQFAPRAATPASLRQPLASLSGGLQAATADRASLHEDVSGLAGTVSALQEQLARQHREIGQLQAQARRATSGMKRLQSRLQALQAEAEAARREAQTNAAQAASRPDAIPLPVALPGSRPDR